MLRREPLMRGRDWLLFLVGCAAYVGVLLALQLGLREWLLHLVCAVGGATGGYCTGELWLGGRRR